MDAQDKQSKKGTTPSSPAEPSKEIGPSNYPAAEEKQRRGIATANTEKAEQQRQAKIEHRELCRRAAETIRAFNFPACTSDAPPHHSPIPQGPSLLLEQLRLLRLQAQEQAKLPSELEKLAVAAKGDKADCCQAIIIAVFGVWQVSTLPHTFLFLFGLNRLAIPLLAGIMAAGWVSDHQTAPPLGGAGSDSIPHPHWSLLGLSPQLSCPPPG
jgi:hypothetical protein